jgi:NAD(P)-dependent dehydrogenase (short-subunit alcohol dehydrogenase family)
MADQLQGRAAIVTGAGSIGPGWGNGKATAAVFAREGARVLCVDICMNAAQETAEIIAGEGNRAIAYECDVTDSAQVKLIVETCKREFGSVDILHNNVGILGMGGPVDHTEEDWDRVNAVNVKSMFLTCKHAIPEMEAQGKGAIVNISSIVGIRWMGVPYLSYSTTKAAIVQLTKSIAYQYAPKQIRCNAILPGLMRTPMVEVGLADAYADGDVDEMIRLRDSQCPMGHMGDAWDVANAALFLVSDEAKYITGAELVVDGGISLSSAPNA